MLLKLRKMYPVIKGLSKAVLRITVFSADVKDYRKRRGDRLIGYSSIIT